MLVDKQTILVKQTSFNGTTVDVFTGKGWTNWSRFEIRQSQGKLHLKLIKGVPMSREDFTTLYERLNAK